MIRSNLVFASCISAFTLMALPAQAALPRYDHILVVVMENHRPGQVVGNASAPYITALARQGANFTNSHGIGHPSQPNYLALFSGSTHGVTSDRCPYSLANADNLGAQLIAAGLSFTGYSEGMPAAGYLGCRDGDYVRKHNPWADFANVPNRANQPYSAFPHDFALLPTVAFVVPNMVDDMHDGSVKAGDAWLAAHIDAYVQWAKVHNSLLILTFDEDDYLTSTNQIPTIMAGAGIAPGDYGDLINHYNILATIESMCGLPALTTAPPISAPFMARTGD